MKQLEKIKIDVPIYNMTIDFRLGDMKNLKAAILKDYKVKVVDEDEVLARAGGVAFNLEKEYNVGNTILIAIDNFWNYEFSYCLSLAMHEIIHATNMIIGNRGMTSSEDDDENLTYISSYIFDNFLKKIEIDKLQKKMIKEFKNH